MKIRNMPHKNYFEIKAKNYYDLGFQKGSFPNSEQMANETLALPISQEVTLQQQEHVVKTITSYFS